MINEWSDVYSCLLFMVHIFISDPIQNQSHEILHIIRLEILMHIVKQDPCLPIQMLIAIIINTPQKYYRNQIYIPRKQLSFIFKFNYYDQLYWKFAFALEQNEIAFGFKTKESSQHIKTKFNVEQKGYTHRRVKIIKKWP